MGKSEFEFGCGDIDNKDIPLEPKKRFKVLIIAMSSKPSPFVPPKIGLQVAPDYTKG